MARKRETTKRRSARRRRLRLGRLWAIGVVVVVAYLYYRPLSSWLHTRAALTQRTQQVQVLQAQKAALEQDVIRATSLTQLARSARRIGLVRPGERLFLVEGISHWRRAHPQPR